MLVTPVSLPELWSGDGFIVSVGSGGSTPVASQKRECSRYRLGTAVDPQFVALIRARPQTIVADIPPEMGSNRPVNRTGMRAVPENESGMPIRRARMVSYGTSGVTTSIGVV